MAKFSVADAEEVYRINSWGDPYFSISAAGEVEAALKRGKNTVKVSLCQIVEGMEEGGIALAVMVRFGDILDSRIALILSRCVRPSEKQYSPRAIAGCFRWLWPSAEGIPRQAGIKGRRHR